MLYSFQLNTQPSRKKQETSPRCFSGELQLPPSDGSRRGCSSKGLTPPAKTSFRINVAWTVPWTSDFHSRSPGRDAYRVRSLCLHSPFPGLRSNLLNSFFFSVEEQAPLQGRDQQHFLTIIQLHDRRRLFQHQLRVTDPLV